LTYGLFVERDVFVSAGADEEEPEEGGEKGESDDSTYDSTDDCSDVYCQWPI